VARQARVSSLVVRLLESSSVPRAGFKSRCAEQRLLMPWR
jgi:hypothetical protein